MGSNNGSGAKVIFAQIDALFTSHVGPFSVVLCKESLSEWLAELQKKGDQPTLRNIAGYIRRLSQHIDNPNHRQDFVNAVYQIKALGHYRQYFNEEH